MTRVQSLRAAAAALALMGLSTAAQAAPAAGVAATAGDALKSAAQVNSAVETVEYTCWWGRHGRRCGYTSPRVYSYYYAPPRRHFYGFGHGYGHRRGWY
jgi:hypothetical protein